jgi:hypothetical protein
VDNSPWFDVGSVDEAGNRDTSDPNREASGGTKRPEEQRDTTKRSVLVTGWGDFSAHQNVYCLNMVKRRRKTP